MSRFAGLRERLITAVALALTLLVILFAMPPLATVVCIVVAILGGAWEWSAFLHPLQRRLRIAYVLLIALGLWAAWQASLQPAGFIALLVVAALWWLVALGWIMLAPARGGAVSAAIAGVFTLVPTGVVLARLRFEGEGAWVLLYSLLVIMAADVGAYFAGHRLGRTKLAPQVSPGKTWEGVLGGFAVSLLVASIGAYGLGWPIAIVLPIVLGAAAFSVVGDLTESLMKRHTGLKDSGHLFPGHGGVLDRIDSLSAGVPLLALGLLKAGLIGGGVFALAGVPAGGLE